MSILSFDRLISIIETICKIILKAIGVLNDNEEVSES